MIVRGDAQHLPIRDGCSQLVLTSPPYNVGWDYGPDGVQDRMPHEEYLAFLERVLAECHRILRPGGVLALNLPQTIRLPDVKARAWPISAWAHLHLLATNWLLREPVVWVKSKSEVAAHANGTAIGGPRNPYLRPTHEMLLLASKDGYQMQGKASRRWPGDSDAFGSYLEACKDVWPMLPGRALPGQPLRFPAELVTRTVRLFSEPGDLVVDPFSGTGTTVYWARALGRRAIGVDLSEAHCARASAYCSQVVLAEVGA